MIGRARTPGAISILNALRTGIGGATGIELPVDTEVELRPGRSEDSFDPEGSDTPIVRTAVDWVRRSYAQGVPAAVAVRIRSEVPARCGLKSSSAVAMGVLAAAARAFGADPPTMTLASAAAARSREIGQSATGALDDNLATSGTGIWITDNRRDAVLRHDPTPPGYRVVLWIPPGSHRPSPEWAARLSDPEPSAAVPLALAGYPFEALEQNGREIEERLGLPPTDRAALKARGATASGVTGLGPARAVVAPFGRVAGIAEFLGTLPGEVRIVDFVTEAGRAEGELR